MKLDGIKEMPPPSCRVNAYVKLNGEKIILKKWVLAKE